MLSEALLRAHPWRLSAGAGALLAPTLRFLSDGLTWGHPSPLEARWALQPGSLSLFALDGSETARFNQFGYDETGQPCLAGSCLRAPSPGLTYHLKPATPVTPPGQTGTLQSLVTVGGPSKILFVSFASMKRGFSGHHVAWEFRDLAIELGLDHVLFAESTSPGQMWYIDKTSRIRALLDAVLQTGYRMVMMCGISSGGYASLLFSEKLAQDHPTIQFRSFTINPQTAHGDAAQAHLHSLRTDYLPALITQAALALRDTPETEIAEIARRSKYRKNLQHHLFYDAGNPAEVFYANQLNGLPGIHHHRYHFAVGHLSGCIALYERQVAHDKIRTFVNAFVEAV